jgi:hypothetical protein
VDIERRRAVFDGLPHEEQERRREISASKKRAKDRRRAERFAKKTASRFGETAVERESREKLAIPYQDGPEYFKRSIGECRGQGEIAAEQLHAGRMAHRNALARIYEHFLFISHRGILVDQTRVWCEKNGVTGTKRTHPILLLIKACLRRSPSEGITKTASDKSASRDARALRYAILKEVPPKKVARFLAKRGLDRCAQRYAAHVKREREHEAREKTDAFNEYLGDDLGADASPDTIKKLSEMPPIRVRKIAVKQLLKLHARNKWDLAAKMYVKDPHGKVYLSIRSICERRD